MSGPEVPSLPPKRRISGMAKLVRAGPLPADREWRRWGLGEAFVGLVAAQVVAGVFGAVVLELGGYDDFDSFPMWLVALTTLPLQLTLAIAVSWAASRGGGVVRDFFVTWQLRDVARGLVIGVLAQFVLVPLVTYPIIWIFDVDADKISEPARDLTDRATGPVGVAALILVVGVMAPIVEELFFRGLLYGSYRKRANLPWLASVLPSRMAPDTASPRWNVFVATVLSGLVFGAIHFQPLLLPALFAVGMLFAHLYERYGRLSVAVWAHVGFNGTTLVSLLLVD